MTGSPPFALETIAEGGLLLDLESGRLFVLNSTAAFVWERALSGMDPGTIAVALSSTYKVDPRVAEGSVSAALSVPPPAPRTELPAAVDLRYEISDEGYRLSAADRPLFEVSRSGHALRSLIAMSPDVLSAHLRALSPKLAALRGAFVLHASAVQNAGGGIIAFAGPSGAGKTTTAHMFREAGYKLVSVDKVVVRFEDKRARVVPSGEGELELAMATLRQRLLGSAIGAWCDVDSTITGISAGPTCNLDEILLVDPQCRQGTSITLDRLAPPSAAAQIFANAFLGSASSGEWRSCLEGSAHIARTAPIHRATMPVGHAALVEAARRYTAMTAS